MKNEMNPIAAVRVRRVGSPHAEREMIAATAAATSECEGRMSGVPLIEDDDALAVSVKTLGASMASDHTSNDAVDSGRPTRERLISETR